MDVDIARSLEPVSLACALVHILFFSVCVCVCVCVRERERERERERLVHLKSNGND